MRRLESARLDAIRQVDVAARTTEAERALQAIQALAATTATNADNLRNALTSTATTIATQLASTVEGLTKRIAALEMTSYKGEGKDTGTTDTYNTIRNAIMLALALGAFALGRFILK
jgi:7-cyano-7-deazaguanine synthase in queuosine biosynthesis